MKIVGIGCGRKHGNNEMLLRAALKEASALPEAEIVLIRLQDLMIRPCAGCETCMRGLTSNGDGACVLKDDDFLWLTRMLEDADGIILAAPVYNLIPAGAVITLLNRSLGIGKAYQKACRAAPKIGAVIAQGGSDWINLAEPILDLTLCNLSKGALVVDRMISGHATAPAMVVLDEEAIARAKLLGRRFAAALSDRARAVYQGDPGICPVCHGRLFELHDGGRVNCPYCNAQGLLSARDGAIKILWEKESVARHRFSEYGEQKHRADIAASHKKAAANRAIIVERCAELENFGEKIASPRRHTVKEELG